MNDKEEIPYSVSRVNVLEVATTISSSYSSISYVRSTKNILPIK